MTVSCARIVQVITCSLPCCYLLWLLLLMLFALLLSLLLLLLLLWWSLSSGVAVFFNSGVPRIWDVEGGGGNCLLFRHLYKVSVHIKGKHVLMNVGMINLSCWCLSVIKLMFITVKTILFIHFFTFLFFISF